MICKACGQPMTKAFSEQDSEYANVSIDTWHCPTCGETVTEPKVDIIISDDDFDYDDDWFNDEDSEFDCGWTGESSQLCDDIGTESCSFFCPLYRAMMATLTDNAKPPTWAEKEE